MKERFSLGKLLKNHIDSKGNYKCSRHSRCVTVIPDCHSLSFVSSGIITTPCPPGMVSLHPGTLEFNIHCDCNPKINNQQMNSPLSKKHLHFKRGVQSGFPLSQTHFESCCKACISKIVDEPLDWIFQEGRREHCSDAARGGIISPRLASSEARGVCYPQVGL